MKTHVVVICIFLSCTAWSKWLTLEEISRLAVERSATIQAEAKALESQTWSARDALRPANPAVSVQLGGLKSGGDSNWTGEVSVLQPLRWAGTRSALSIQGEAHRSIAQLSLEEAERTIQHASVVTAFRLAALNEIAEHSVERRRHYELIQEYFRHHPQVSPAQRIDAALIENELRLLEKGMLELQLERESAARQLSFYLGTSESVEPAIAWDVASAPPPLAVLLERLFSHSPQWRSHQHERALAQEDVRLARLQSRGDLGIGGGYRYEDIAPANRFFWGTLNLSLPVWNQGQFRVSAAQARLLSRDEEQTALRRQLERDLQQAHAEAESTFQILQRFPMPLIKRSEEIFHDAEREFLKGRITSTAFLQTDAQIHETLDTIFQTHVTYLEKLSTLLKLTGLPLTWPVVNPEATRSPK